MKHKWTKDEDGAVDEWAWESGFHNGPVCEICGARPCIHCTPDYDELECHGEPHRTNPTNADRIRAMSVETLCSFLFGWQMSTLEDAQNGIYPDREGCEDWLQQPAPEEGEQNV